MTYCADAKCIVVECSYFPEVDEPSSSLVESLQPEGHGQEEDEDYERVHTEGGRGGGRERGRMGRE